MDPGAYIYTASVDMRNLFRSTKYHNTVVVDNKEQNKFEEAELFSMHYDAEVRVNRWEPTQEYDFLDAEHDGYKRLKDPVIHRRQIWFDKTGGLWIIKDILSSKGIHQFDLYFHFAPMEVEVDSSYPLAVRTKTGGANVAVVPLDEEGLSVDIMSGWVSYSYGAKETAPIVKYSKNCACGTFSTVIYPYRGELSIAEILERVEPVHPRRGQIELIWSSRLS